MTDGFKEKECIEASVLLDTYSTAAIDISDKLSEEIFTVIDVESSGDFYRSYYKNGKLEIERNDAFTILSRGENEIVIKADSYLQAVELEGDYNFSDNYFAMLEGEVKTVAFEKFSENANEVSVKTYTLM